LSSTELLISWVAPLPELRHGDIQGYNVGYKLSSSGNTAYNFTSVAGDYDGGNGELLLSGLAKFARYNVVVQAFNQVGPGPLSEPTGAQTMEDGNTLLLTYLERLITMDLKFIILGA